MKKFLFLFLFVLISLSETSSVNAQELISKDSIAAILRDLKDKSKVRSLIAAVRKGDEEILTVALGESMTSVPADAGMHLRIGGISETFFGTLLMILSDKGMIDIDEKISVWLPDLLSADKVTPRMLIKNTAGYKDYVTDKDFVGLFTKEPFRNFSREELIRYSVKDGEMNFPPGTDQRYSHTEFTILGEVLEKATGKTLAELYEDFIFSKLDLKNTGYTFNSDLPYPVLHAYSSDRGIYEDATFWNPSWTKESGTVYSNIYDVAKWARIFGTGRLLKPESFKQLTGPPDVNVDPEKYFASGFGVMKGWYIQNPSFNGYSGGFGYLPSGEITLIVFTTQSEDTASYSQAYPILKELTKILTPENVLD
ncbi:MAG TPA: serine hydrolase domain-containing protein [Ignavibacteria bacterium]|nr:serine hydrolase domain-containing protein [Ignavibacteria bacterium]